MPQFEWKGRKRTGETVEGVMPADNKDGVIVALRRQQIVATKVTEKGKEFALPKLGGGVKTKELAIFTRQFSVMIDAGLPVVQCLEILGTQQANRGFQRVLFEIREDVESGSSLHEAFKKHPKVFDNLYCNLVAAGEAGGILDNILQRLSIYIEKAVKLKAAVKSAMIYPAVVVTVAVLVVTIIMWKVVPTFANLFEGLGAKLPLPTRIVIAISHFLERWAIIIFIAVIGLVFAFRVYYKTTGGRYLVDKIVLKAPVIGIVIKKIAVARFCRTLATLVASGVPIPRGTGYHRQDFGQRGGRRSAHEDAEIRRGGEDAHPTSGRVRHFPGMVTQMISVGESTGALDAMLGKIADFYEDEVDEAVGNLMSLLEPIIIVFLGTTIGGIVIAMYLPLFTLIQQIQ